MATVYRLAQDRARWYAIMAAVLVLGAGWLWLSAVPGSATTGGRIPSPREGFLAPEFSLEQLGGGEVALSELRGEVVVINFWASWCPPCRAEMPALQQVYESTRALGVKVLAVNTTYQDSEGDAIAFAEGLGLTFPILFERTGEVGRRYQLRAMPSTFFVDHEGVIQKVIIGGPMSEATIQTAIEELLQEVP